MKSLVILEHNQTHLLAANYNAITAAAQLSDHIDVLIAGLDCQAAVDEAASIKGVKQVLYANAAEYRHPLAENLSMLISEYAREYTHILAASNTYAKNIMPRVAALLDVAQISDITHIESPDTFIRPIYAGNALAKVQSLDAIKVITVRQTAFPAAEKNETVAVVKNISLQCDMKLSEFVGMQATKSERPELTSAKVVISGGRALGSSENFKLLEELADRLNAAIGASRAAVDAGYVPNDYQVGQTGKVVAPDLYVAVGISGAIQHIAGMKDSKIIVAINKDEDAPIFKIANYGIVGDLFKIIPELNAELDKVLK